MNFFIQHTLFISRNMKNYSFCNCVQAGFYLVKGLLQAKWHTNSRWDIAVVGTCYSSPCFPLWSTMNHFSSWCKAHCWTGEGHSVLHCCSFDQKIFSAASKKPFIHRRAGMYEGVTDNPQIILQRCSCWQCQFIHFFIPFSWMQCWRVSQATQCQWHSK